MIEEGERTDPRSSFLAPRRAVRWNRLLIVLAILVPLVWLLAYGFSRDPRYITSPLIARPAPSFAVTLFDGKRVTLADLRGKVVFLNFWASWCPPCRAEAREIEAVWRRLRNEEIVFLGINIQDTDEDALGFIDEFELTYPNGRDSSGKIAIDFGVWGIPETFFIGRDGTITYKHVGTLGPTLIATKLDEARQGLTSAKEGKGSYQPIR